jgi:hypothetical protein
MNLLMYYSLGNLMIKGKLGAKRMIENIIQSNIIIYKSSNLCFNSIPLKNKVKCLLLIITTLTMYYIKSN